MVGMNPIGELWIPNQRVRVGGPVATGVTRAEGTKRVSESLGEGSRRVCRRCSQRRQFYASSAGSGFPWEKRGQQRVNRTKSAPTGHSDRRRRETHRRRLRSIEQREQAGRWKRGKQ